LLFSNVNYAISCGHDLTAQAAEDVLKAGGNALDAAIAAFASSWVVEPCMSGPGGGGFAVIKRGSHFFALDFFTQTPEQKRIASDIDFRKVNVDFGATTEVFHYGLGSIAVPGAIDGLFALHEMGARMPMGELLKTAIDYAKEGHTLVPFQRYNMELLQDIIGSSSRGQQLFFEHETLKNSGDELMMPYLADFLDFLGLEGPDAFYQGEVANKISQACEQNGGHLTSADLKKYHTSIYKAKHCTKDGLDVITTGLPSVGSKILNAIIYHTDVQSRRGVEKSLIEAMTVVHKMKTQWFEPGWNIKEGGTSHISVIDGKGDAVSLSMSLGEGSGYFVEGTDIHMNNMLGEAALLPAGWHSWIPDTRLKSMMTPAIALDPGRDLIIALGSGGAARIPFMTAQVLMNLHCTPMSMQQSVDAARAHWDGKHWQAEPGYNIPEDMRGELWNQWAEKNLYFGGVHAAAISKGNYVARSDDRRSGSAIFC
jgi:gamma-glutamyltranspeptidase/glutathione hydrolase